MSYVRKSERPLDKEPIMNECELQQNGAGAAGDLGDAESTWDQQGMRHRSATVPIDSPSSTNSTTVYDVNAHSPLVVSTQIRDLTRSLSAPWGEMGEGDGILKKDGDEDKYHSKHRNLGWIGGVFAAVALAQFSTNLFLRVGFVVGQSGILLALTQFLLAYGILLLTILSICAISTNGCIERGGAYFMISRTLGPEFGGSIGALFYLANIFSCALYISGFVEGLVNTFPQLAMIDNTRWWDYLYCTAVLALCLIVCIIGGAMFARTSVFILMIVIICTLSVIVSMFIEPAKQIECPPDPSANSTQPIYCGNYTGFSLETFKGNLYSNYTIDYVTEKQMTFAAVFAILFSSVTGIMNGANMSGELVEPSRAIPKGTMAATSFTFVTYLIMAVITAFTCQKGLLISNYNYLKLINAWAPFVVIGIFAATISAALGNLIGASRILEALAHDKIFGKLLSKADWTTRGGNPIVAVVVSWALVQCILLIGSLNAIAPMASILFLLSYASTNLTCLALELASAPNFRPTFKYFTWHTSFLGLVGCLVMCFLIQAAYASGAMLICMLLVIALHLRTFDDSWGSISQALIFHQVRKYLLMLDIRKEHVKFWRPQMLLLVSNPLTCVDTIDFINDVKKGGLYVLGHVKVGDFEKQNKDVCQQQYGSWLSLVDLLKVKAFVELTMARSVREGMQHLVRLSGLGGMKPNTVCMGFYDSTAAVNSLVTRGTTPSNILRRKLYTQERRTPDANTLSQSGNFPCVRIDGEEKHFEPTEYVQIIQDIFKMEKNICVFRHFSNLHKDTIFKSTQKYYIDVWPVNVFRPDTVNYFDHSCLFMLQLACILQMVPGWSKHTTMRIHMCIEEDNEEAAQIKVKLESLLGGLRIIGDLQKVNWSHVTALHSPPPPPASTSSAAETEASEASTSSHPPQPRPQQTVSMEYLQEMNKLIKSKSANTAITFLYLPRVPSGNGLSKDGREPLYLSQLKELTNDLPPTVLVHGFHSVTSTTL